MSTRPRITFDSNGVCSACQWAEIKKNLDWSKRLEQLQDLVDESRYVSPFNCIVAVSGGKDGSYVSHNLREKYGMNPLTITVRPGLETQLGLNNISNFIESGFNHIHVSPDPRVMKALNKRGLIETGFSYHGWLVAIHSVVLRFAILFKIPLIFYSEDGECEYGGDMKLADNGVYGVDYMISAYMESGYEKVVRQSGLTDRELYWYLMPTQDELDSLDIKVTHWGFYENWDPYRNYTYAKENCGLMESTSQNTGTYTNFGQTDQDLFPLHVYLMYLKYGFGRATMDAGIDVRRGAMDREQAVQLVRMYDNFDPKIHYEVWCKYYDMTATELEEVFDRWANSDLFAKNENGRWMPCFEIA